MTATPKQKFATKQAANRERARREKIRRQLSAEHLAALQEGQRRGHERRAAEQAAEEAERAALRERIRKPLDDSHPDILRCREERAKRSDRIAPILLECRAKLLAEDEAAKRAHRGGRPKKGAVRG